MTPPPGLNPASSPSSAAAADFERIVPQRRTHAASTDPLRVAPDAASRISARSFWIAMLGLLLCAAILFWFLPGVVSPPAVQPAVVPARAETPAPAAAGPAPSTPAWDDPALLAARAGAQAAKAQFEAQRAQLLAQGVARWGARELARADQQAVAGTSAFAAKDYAAAGREHAAAAAAAQTLLAGIPQRLRTALADGARALEAGDKLAAQQAFELAQALDPGNAPALRGLARVANLDALRARLDTARRLEQADDLAGARRAYIEALALDGDSTVARDALARLDAQAADAAHARALGAALSALDRGAYDEAERQLAQARRLRANDPALQQASARVAEARRGQTLAQLEREASAQLAAEDWSGAAASYRRAVQLDASLAFAHQGLAQAEPRARLAQRLQDHVARPDRLASAAAAGEAGQVLAEARAIPNPGPRHLAQMQALERALADANTPIPVSLSSDGQTEVTLYKIGALGRFSAQALTLKPGHYVAVGARNGFRDVRVEFEVVAGAQNAVVDIRCKEPL